jgi:hypothetical protein
MLNTQRINPFISVSGDNIFIAWDTALRNTELHGHLIFLAVSNDGGTTYNNKRFISNIARNSILGSLDSFENNAYLVWAEDYFDTRLVYGFYKIPFQRLTLQ